MEPKAMLVGKSVLLTDSEHFLDGYQAGKLACDVDCQSGQITNELLTTIMMEKLESLDFPEQYSIGYCAGWIARFATKEHTGRTS